MENLKKRLQRKTLLVDELRTRGFFYEEMPDEDPNHIPFVKSLFGGLSIRLLMSPSGTKLVSPAILLASSEVSRVNHDLGLYFNDRVKPAGRSTTILSVDLLWLRWNSTPELAENYRHGYEFEVEYGVRRLLDDLDTVGQTFIDSVCTPHALAQCLFALDDYPSQIKWGGKPISREQYIFAAILFLQAGDKLSAMSALDKGQHEFDSSAKSIKPSDDRIDVYKARCARLRQEIEQH